MSKVTIECERCHFPIDPGWYHKEQVQDEGSNVVVCELRRAKPRLKVVPND